VNKMTNFRIMGYYNINDIKYDILKIITPYDGYMFNQEDIDTVTKLFGAYLGDLKKNYKIFSYVINVTEKSNAFTFDIEIKMQKERSPKKLKIHVGRINYPEKGWTEAAIIAKYGDHREAANA
tara:strand:- start:1013 stop:1381 length:369 start_codon:yes stop_codon:yes gene_type:complete